MIAGLAYPTKRDEAWRYAPHDVLGKLSFGPPAASTHGLPAALEANIPALDGPRIVMVNGVVDAERSDLSALPAGLRLSAFDDARSEHPELLGAHFDTDADRSANPFAALNIAFGRNGAVVHVAGGHAIDAPIQIIDIALPDDTTNTSCSGVVIHLEDGATATVVETKLGHGDFGGSNTRTTITLGDQASLTHVVLQDIAPTQVHLGCIDTTQGVGSVLRSHLFNLGGRYGRVDYDVSLAGEGALVELTGLYFGRGNQVLDQQVTVVHAAPNCTSRQSFRGILDDESTGVFNGGIDVRPGADGTDAEQSNDNLLLSDRAEANTQPRLEILADQVACKHGATVGQLDDDALYYLRTRGIPEAEARRLLIGGFADQAVDTVDNEILRTWITERLHHDDG
ncbi:MAG: Fe-S cluster assembly protein SufD [Candidatus Aldehydirespiratoraceae bacterium]|jgi:Fe-S cluster assembly protein SufD